MKNLITTIMTTSLIASSAIVYAAPSTAPARVTPIKGAVKTVDKKEAKRPTLTRARPLLKKKVKPATEVVPAPVVNRCRELDMNDDKQINSSDRDLFVKGLTHIIDKSLDANGDHYVNVLDLVTYASQTQAEIRSFSTSVTKCAQAQRTYDANRDGEFNVRDLVQLRAMGRLNPTLARNLSACIVGEFDYNGDSETNVLDTVNFIQDQMLAQQAFSNAAMAWIQGEAHDIYDINKDSNLNVADVVLYLRHYMACTAMN